MIKEGDTVTVHYEGKLDDGTVFDSSKHGDHDHPLTFTVGQKQVIPGFEKGVVGMKKGDKKDIVIKPKDAYGEPNPKMLKKMPRSQVPNSEKIEKGMQLLVALPNGQQMPVVIADADKDTVTLDLNHPLAGKTLHFNVEVVKVDAK